MDNISKELKKHYELITSLLSIIIKSQRPNGSLGDDDANVLTHHLVLALKEWKSDIFNELINDAINWFDEMANNYPESREAREDDFDPFKLIAFASYKDKRTKSYVESKLDVFKKKHLRPAGYAVLDLGFRDAQDIADVFPTLSAVNLLLNHGSDEALSIAKKSLNWCQEMIENNSVYDNKSSILGYAAINITQYFYLSRDPSFNDFQEHLIQTIISEQKNGVWENSAYQSCYLLYDLAYIYNRTKNVKLLSPIISFLGIINDDFFSKYELLGQRFYLVAFTLLRAFSYLLDNKQKKIILKNVSLSLFKDASELFFKERHINARLEFVNNFHKHYEAKNFLIVNPKLFKSRKFNKNNKNVFVIMPFGKKKWIDVPKGHGYPQEKEFDFNQLYNSVLRPAIEQLGLNADRADSGFTPNSLMEKIWTKINEAAVIITVLTSVNPNVLYELGISHTLGIPVILLLQSGQNIPSDINFIEHIPYDGQIGKENELIEKVKNAITDSYRSYDE